MLEIDRLRARGVDDLTLTNTLGNPFWAEQRERLLEIANRCPVHRTLTSDKVRSYLSAEGGE